ncbi:MAG: hypothetical protein NVS3B21_11200 [Acidimicrobiales bacterium]
MQRTITVNANGVDLGIESFGDDDAPLALLAGGTTMLSWPDALCERPYASMPTNSSRRRYDKAVASTITSEVMLEGASGSTSQAAAPAKPGRRRQRRLGTCRDCVSALSASVPRRPWSIEDPL